MRTFVLGDIHGAAKALDQCLDRSGINPDLDVLVQLGDVTDGYPDVFESVETLLRFKTLVAIKGNHDDWFLEFINTGLHPEGWRQGGVGTLISYLSHASIKPVVYTKADDGYRSELLSSDIPVSHQRFFMRQQLFHIDEMRRCFVHAGFRPHLTMDRQHRKDFFWDRSLWGNAFQKKISSHRPGEPDTPRIVPDFAEVYLGHTPTTNWGTDRPLNAFNIWNLDTGAGHIGRLTIMDVDTKKFWQSDPLSTLYTENFR